MNLNHDRTFIGYFLKRTNLLNPSVVDLLRELKHFLFEAIIMNSSLDAFFTKQALKFDCSVGDWKCQVRSSIIVDLFDKISFVERESLLKEKIKVSELVFKLEKLIERTTNLNSVQRQNLTKNELQKKSIVHFLQKNEIDYVPSKNLEFLSLCFLTTLRKNELSFFINDFISLHKMKAAINIAKSTLCQFSVEYELDLAKEYFLSTDQVLLQQIEVKNVQFMTSLFAGFRAIFEKMKKRGQGFLIKDFNFCQCGGISKLSTRYFVFQSGSLEEDVLPLNLDQIVTIMLVFQFPGSMVQLQNTLGVSNDEVDIPKEYYQRCLCAQPSMQQEINSIEEAIMAFFAQHPQFTNGSQINWDGFGLADSELKKEYDYLLTLPGFSRNDMSKFQIIHMYPDTIKNVLHEQKELQTKLNLI